MYPMKEKTTITMVQYTRFCQGVSLRYSSPDMFGTPTANSLRANVKVTGALGRPRRVTC